MDEPRWKKECRGLFFILVILAGIPGLLSAYFHISAHKAGAEKPTAGKIIPNTQHARTKYISKQEAERIQLTWMIFLIAFPSAFLFGFILRFVFKVDIFKQEPMPPRIKEIINNLRQNSYEKF